MSESESDRRSAIDRLVDYALQGDGRRWVGAGVLVWAWLTVVGFNLSMTREFLNQTGNRSSSYPYLPSFVGPTVIGPQVGVKPEDNKEPAELVVLRWSYAITGLIPLVAWFPALFAWVKLIGLTRVIGGLVLRLVGRWTPDPPPQSAVLPPPTNSPIGDWERQQISDAWDYTYSWFRCFAYAWLVLLLSGVARGAVTSLSVVLYQPVFPA